MPSLRADGLPKPVTAEQEYLAAILDELRGLAHAASSPAPEGEAEVVELREPEVPVDNSPTVTEKEASEAARVLSTSDEVASEAGRVLAEHEHQQPPAKKPAAKPSAKRSTR